MLVVANGAFKSGSTWQSDIARALVDPHPIPVQYQRPEWINPSIRPGRLSEFLASGLHRDEDFVSKSHIRDLATRDLLLMDPDVLVLTITRDLRDVLVSAYHHDIREGGANGSLVEYWDGPGRRRLEGVVEHHRVWNFGHEQVFVGSYELLHLSFRAQVESMARFLGVELTRERLGEIRGATDFERKQQANANGFYRRGIVGSWRDELPARLAVEVQRLTAT